MKLKETLLAADYLPHHFTFFKDGGHGWLRVPHMVIEDLDMGSESFSGYSYVDHEYMYLEEDVDYALFINAYLAKYGAEPTYKYHYEEYSAIKQKMRNRRGT